MKIIIIGSESFIGTELKKQCALKGIEFVGVDTAPSKDPGHIQLDIRAPEIVDALPENADAMVHLAAISRDQDCRKDTIGAFDVNVKGTLNLMKAAQARKTKQFVFASSEWVYGNTPEGSVQTEETVIDMSTVMSEYALTKMVGERLLCMAQSRGDCPPATVLRFGIVYGPRPKPMSAVEGLFNEVRTLDTVEIKGSLRSGRRFIHVTDISKGILAALGRTGFEIFNLSGNRFISFREIIETSAKLLNRKPRMIETDPEKTNVRNPDNQKARQAFNWNPSIDLEQGLATLADYIQKTGGKSV
jgi:UDP-glucose 4-epimerase